MCVYLFFFCVGYTCPDGKCIPENKICDGVRDCLEGTDEINCGRDKK